MLPPWVCFSLTQAHLYRLNIKYALFFRWFGGFFEAQESGIDSRWGAIATGSRARRGQSGKPLSVLRGKQGCEKKHKNHFFLRPWFVSWTTVQMTASWKHLSSYSRTAARRSFVLNRYLMNIGGLPNPLAVYQAEPTWNCIWSSEKKANRS